MKEAEVWEKIEREKARQRQLSGLKNQDIVTPHGLEREITGETNDIVADKIGIGSKNTYLRAKKAIEKLIN